MQKKRAKNGSIQQVRNRLIALVCSVLMPMIFLPTMLHLHADMGQPPIELPPLDEVVCESYIVYNRTKDEVVISKDPDKRIYPASMTKVMTVALALEYLDTSEYVVVSQTAMSATTPNSTMMGLIAGEKVRVSELIYGAMLPSGNDAANVLAESVVLAARAQSCVALLLEEDDLDEQSLLEQFNNMMNNKALELGLTQTHFMNSNGLHHDMHYTTAAELAVIFDYALSFEAFRIVINTPSHVYQSTNMHSFDGWRIARNTNFLLTDPWILGEDTNVVQVVGGKTGTTVVAGTGMAVLAVNQNGDELMTVVCGIPYNSANRQTTFVATILNAGALESFERDPVVRVEGSVLDYVPINAPSEIYIEGPSKAHEDPDEDLGTDSDPVIQTQETSPVTPSESTDQDEGVWAFFTSHPIIIISIAAFVLVVLLLVFLLIIPAFVSGKRKKGRKSHYDGIRRI